MLNAIHCLNNNLKFFLPRSLLQGLLGKRGEFIIIHSSCARILWSVAFCCFYSCSFPGRDQETAVSWCVYKTIWIQAGNTVVEYREYKALAFFCFIVNPTSHLQFCRFFFKQDMAFLSFKVSIIFSLFSLTLFYIMLFYIKLSCFDKTLKLIEGWALS